MSQSIYTRVPVPKFPRNTFSLSRPVQGSMGFHKLYCTNAHVVVPGDGFIEGSECFTRLEPMVAPAMTKIDIQQHAFYVPFWQLNEHFDDFITSGENGDFTEKMPWFTVNDFYTIVSDLISEDSLPFDVTGDAALSLPFAKAEYSFRLDLALRIMNFLDWFRAVPFKQPEFMDPNAAVGSEQLQVIIQANEDAFTTLNQTDLEGSSLRVNLCPLFAYQKVYSEYFRDENLSPDLWKFGRENFDIDALLNQQDLSNFYSVSTLRVYFLGPVPEDLSSDYSRSEYTWKFLELFALHRRAWRKDRYTGALPFAQKGDDVLLPLSGIFDVDNDTVSSVSPGSTAVSYVGASKSLSAGGVGITQKVDISNAGTGQGTTIRELREAFAAESFNEANGRYGSRYPEFTLGQFGVITPDGRLPRAQFLGSRTQTVMVSEVAQTSESGDTPQGNLAGKGSSYGAGLLYKRRFTMHGFVLCLTSIMVRPQYEGGIAPMFSYFDRTDYAFPRFARLGEEPVYTKEIAVVGDSDGPLVAENDVFGYAPRYSSFKSDVGSIHGLLKSSRAYWTFSRRWNGKPALNEEFVYNPPRLDAFALTNPFEDQFTVEIDYRVRAQRILPFWGVPMI